MRKMPHALAVPAVLLLAAGVAACGGAVPVTTSTGAAAPTGQQTSGSNGGASSAKPSTGANHVRASIGRLSRSPHRVIGPFITTPSQ